MRNIEQELKLALTEREYKLVLAKADGAEPLSLVNYYFACDDLPRDIMVRIRHFADRYVLCFKQRLSHGDGVMVCDEHEIAVDDVFAQKAISDGIGYVSLNRMFDVDVFKSNLHCVGSAETLRTPFMLSEWHIELDKFSYLGRTDYELECELDDVDKLNKLKNYLNHTFGIVMRNSLPKNQRFFQALNDGQE